MTEPLTKRLTAETIGTALLLAAVVGSGIMAERLADGNMAVALLANTLATAAMLVVIITLFGSISAHFNPAVSLVMAIRRELPWQEVMPYILAQLAGACIGVLLAHAMFEMPLFEISLKARSGSAQMLSEAVATFGLIGVIIGCLTQNVKAIPYAVALYIASAYWFTASTSFANPAVTIARALTNSFAGIQPADVIGFIAAQIIGAVVAAAIFQRLFKNKLPG
ncbi:MAG TPA: MIP/aquaporin family protein [Alphaproteobacteria bacterium]|nr:aquaporin family protein [Rhodospirillaceae bacterium]HRJ12032.1 MIP/aquaporin family protein [Alphaproteobacteria bacterium]